MYSNDRAVLGASTVAAPTILGIALWPNFTLLILAIAFVVFGILFLAYKRRARLSK